MHMTSVTHFVYKSCNTTMATTLVVVMGRGEGKMGSKGWTFNEDLIAMCYTVSKCETLQKREGATISRDSGVGTLANCFARLRVFLAGKIFPPLSQQLPGRKRYLAYLWR